jgi:predicted dienelactone hydrolase
METASTVVAAAADSAVAAAASHPPCTPGDTSKCLYRPAQTYDVMPSFLEDVTYKDVLGETRTVPIAVYRPKSTPLPAPVVVLSHGGAGGKTAPTKSMDKWAAVVAGAGYIAVAIAHAGRSEQDYAALCEHLKVPETIQCAIKINWDRPHDIGAVLDWLERKSTEAPWKGVLDLSRIAHVGHSAGAGAGQMLGGVPRNFICAQPFGLGQGTVVACEAKHLVPLRTARIDAVLALSPTGPGSEGFMTESFSGLAVPLLMASGTNDGDPGEPANRVAAWDLYPPGQRWKLYIEDPGAQHTLFEGETDACVKVAPAARCRAMRGWLFSTGLAFLDAKLRSDDRARAWLDSGHVGVASGGDAMLVGK